MLEALIAVYCLGIAAVAIRRARRDARFTRRVVVRHVVALVSYFTYAGAGAYAVVKLAAPAHGGQPSDGAVAAWVVVFLAYLGLGLWMLLRAVRRILDRG